MYCFKCGVKNNETSEFCIGCGVNLKIKKDDINKTKTDQDLKKLNNIPNYMVRIVIVIIFNLLFSCFFLGIIPLIFSIISFIYSLQVEKKEKSLDFFGAEESSKTAKIWWGISLATTIIFVVLSIIIFISLMFYKSDLIYEYIQEYLNYVNGRGGF